jgi:hypothetical protein
MLKPLPRLYCLLLIARFSLFIELIRNDDLHTPIDLTAFLS